MVHVSLTPENPIPLSSRSGSFDRVLAEFGTRSILLFTALNDLIPPRYRFGHWQKVVKLLAPRRGLPQLRAADTEPHPLDAPPPTKTNNSQVLRCLIAAGSLDNGGIETVVSVLASGLSRHGIRVEVACSERGRTAEDLEARGVAVTEMETAALPRYIAESGPDVVQFHRIERGMLDAMSKSTSPVVPVFHAMESYLNQRTWEQLELLFQENAIGVAVSSSVRAYVEDHVRGAADIRVIVNCAPKSTARSVPSRIQARAQLAEVLGLDEFADDRVVVSLMRYSDQKNVPGLVDAFLLASERMPHLRLVIAGNPDSWLEVRRADLLRRGHRNGSRVHLLGNSDPGLLLAAADLFAMDSYAEGGPVSAVEAVAQGIPIVLSDVGYARELVTSEEVSGTVVVRANSSFSPRSIAAQRRRRHQSNRLVFAEALVHEPAPQERQIGTPTVPRRFTESMMIREHASVLLEVSKAATN